MWFQLKGQNAEKAFTELFFYYMPRIEPFVFKMTRSKEITEEIIHDVFLGVWLSRQKGTVIENIEAYIFTAATNKTYTYLKKIAREKKRTLVICLPKEENAVEDFIDFKESNQLVKQAIELLPPKRKIAFKLSREEGLSYEEIGEQLHISKNTVKNQILQSLKFIKERLQNSSILPLITGAGLIIRFLFSV